MNKLNKYIVDSYTSDQNDINSFGEFARVPTALAKVINQSNGNFKPKGHITEFKKHWLFVVELPGVTEGNLKILKKNDTLVLKGERKVVDEHSFHLKFDFPFAFKCNNFTSELNNGVLSISLIKSHNFNVNKVKVKPEKINFFDLIFGTNNVEAGTRAS